MKKSRKEQIADLQRNRTEIATKAAADGKKITDRLRPLQKAEAAAERKRQNEQERLVGAWLLDATKSSTEISIAWYNDKIASLTRKDQRALFNLDVEQDHGAAAATDVPSERPMKKKSRKEIIEDLKRQRSDIAAKAAADDKKVADRIRQLQKQDSKAERRRQNRCKFIAGAWVLDAVKNNTEISLAWYKDKVAGLTRKDQRALFNLEPLAEPLVEEQDDKSGETRTNGAGATTAITSNQKGWLQRLLEQQPDLAAELGVPAADNLQNLAKTEASGFIATATERLDQMRIRLKKNS